MTSTRIAFEEQGHIRIRGRDIPVRTLLLEQRKLRFFTDNPRIYSLVRTGGHQPDQEEIYKQLLKLDHVQELIQDIRLNDGLMDPLIVRDETFEVLEGNSRLAACRWLYDKDPIRWAGVKCTLLPPDIDERLVYALLGQYHVKGKKDWAPLEKAGFLYRRFREHQDDIPTVARELGMSQREVKHLIEVYDFMLRHSETDRERWSYYDEYLKSKKMKKVRDQYPIFDQLIVNKIKTGEIRRAVDIRDDLPQICVGPQKNLKRFAEGRVSFEDAHTTAMEAGGDNVALKRLHKFRQWLVSRETEEDLQEAPKTVRDRIRYELDQIEARARKLKVLFSDRAGGPPKE